MKTNLEIEIFCAEDWKEYELLDTGKGEKLERFGAHTFVRPYEDAVWPKTLTDKEWNRADGKFVSSKTGARAGWKFQNKINSKWEVEYKKIKFLITPTPFRHFGFFPEQAVHWDFIEEQIRSAKRPIRFLNLFGYTGVASLFALRAGAEVTHLDASRQSLAWAKENENLNVSQFAGRSMRVIEDDVMKFLEREVKRGNTYDCVIMDPPKFGRGPKGEVWKIEDMLPKLLSYIPKILSDTPLFVIITSYTTESSTLSLGYALSEVMKMYDGTVEAGELCVLEKSNNRVMSLANTAVWSVDSK